MAKPKAMRWPFFCRDIFPRSISTSKTSQTSKFLSNMNLNSTMRLERPTMDDIGKVWRTSCRCSGGNHSDPFPCWTIFQLFQDDFIARKSTSATSSFSCEIFFSNFNLIKRKHCIVLRCSVAFWTHPEIIPVGQFFRRWTKSINQA